MENVIKGRICFSIFLNGCNQSNLSIAAFAGAAKVGIIYFGFQISDFRFFTSEFRVIIGGNMT